MGPSRLVAPGPGMIRTAGEAPLASTGTASVAPILSLAAPAICTSRSPGVGLYSSSRPAFSPPPPPEQAPATNASAATSASNRPRGRGTAPVLADDWDSVDRHSLCTWSVYGLLIEDESGTTPRKPRAGSGLG